MNASDLDESNFYANATFQQDITNVTFAQCDITNVPAEITEDESRMFKYGRDSAFQAYLTGDFESSVVFENSLNADDNEMQANFSRVANANQSMQVTNNYYNSAQEHGNKRETVNNKSTFKEKLLWNCNNIKTLLLKYFLLWIISCLIVLLVFILSVVALALVSQLQNNFNQLQDSLSQIKSKNECFNRQLIIKLFKNFRQFKRTYKYWRHKMDLFDKRKVKLAVM